MGRAIALVLLMVLSTVPTVEAAPPVARLTGPPTTTVGETVIFDASDSSDPDGDLRSYLWNFGDGSNATSATPKIAHAYSKAGIFTVTLAAFDSQGQSSGNATTITVLRSPTRLSVPEVVGKAATAVTIKATLEDARGRPLTGKVVRFLLEGEELGAATTIDGEATGVLNRTRLEPGIHNLTSLFNGDDSYLASSNLSIIKLLPEDVTVTLKGDRSARIGSVFTFNASASSPLHNISHFEWDFDGDGVFESKTFAPNVTHLFTIPGRYNVTVRAVDEKGHAGTVSLEVIAFPEHDSGTDEATRLPEIIPTRIPFTGVLAHMLIVSLLAFTMARLRRGDGR